MNKFMRMLGRIEGRIADVHRKLRERHLYRVIVSYGSALGVIFSIVEFFAPGLRLPDWVPALIMWSAILGLPVIISLGLLTAPSTPSNAVQNAQGDSAPDPSPPGDAKGDAPHGSAGRGQVAPPPKLAPGLPSLIVILIAIMLFGGVALAGDWSEPSAADKPTIAVLPFVNGGGVSVNTALAGDLHAEVTAQLGRIGVLRVISRGSVMRFNAHPRDLKEIAKILGAGALLEATVRQEDDRLILSAELVEGPSGVAVWSQTYSVSVTEGVRLHRALVRDVARAMGLKLTAEERRRFRRPAPDSLAYALYQAGMRRERKPDPTLEEILATERLYDAAVRRDPEFGLALARLSRLSSRMVIAGQDGSRDRRAKAERMADSALAVDPDLPEAHVAQGLFHYWVMKDYELALRELQSASESLPSDPDVQAALGYVYRRTGKWDEALTHLLRAAQLEPLLADRFAEVGYTYRARREHASADQAFQQAFRLDPEYVTVELERGELWAVWQGNTDTLMSVLSRVPVEVDPDGEVTLTRYQAHMLRHDFAAALRTVENHPQDTLTGQTYFYPIPLLRAFVLRAMGDSAGVRAQAALAARRLEAALRASPQRPWVRVTLAHAYAMLGRREEALREAGRAQREVGDQFFGPMMDYQVAAVHAEAGQRQVAILALAELLRRPAGATRHQLRLDPAWESLRSEAQFRSLLVEA